MTDLTGQTAIITGASRGIGEATAVHLAKLGAHVVLAARSADRIEEITEGIQAGGGSARAIPCDVSKEADVRKLLSTTLSETGRLDLLVNNAGVIDPIARLGESDPDAWAHVIDINVKGVYYGLRHAIPEMVALGGGTIINISSGAASGGLEGWSHYNASKAAVLSLTRTVHTEYAAHGIRMIGLSPGTVATDMQIKIKASGINRVSTLDPKVHIPPEWVAQAIAWLTTPDADRYCGTDLSLRDNEARAAIGLPSSG